MALTFVSLGTEYCLPVCLPFLRRRYRDAVGEKGLDVCSSRTVSLRLHREDSASGGRGNTGLSLSLSLRLHQAECARCSSGNALTSSRKIYSAVIMVKRLLVRVYRCIIAADEASLCFSVWRSLSPDRLTHINAYIT